MPPTKATSGVMHMGYSYDLSPNNNMSNGLDTTGAVTTVVSIGSAVVGEVSPHPLQLWAWGIAIASGAVAIILGCVRIWVSLKKMSDE
jgi:hypothetical protein